MADVRDVGRDPYLTLGSEEFVEVDESASPQQANFLRSLTDQLEPVVSYDLLVGAVRWATGSTQGWAAALCGEGISKRDASRLIWRLRVELKDRQRVQRFAW